MHETSQLQRVNHFMSIDSSTLGFSKVSTKKQPFYKHQDPSKLNYYSRFSPNRKQFNEHQQSEFMNGGSPLSPRNSAGSISSKKSRKSVRNRIFKDQSDQPQKKQLQLFNENMLYSANDFNPNRGQIYIDEAQDTTLENLDISTNQYQVDSKIQTNNDENKIISQRDPPEYLIKQSHKQFSQSQQSSSFERMIQQSSSEDNDVPLISTSIKSGAEMLIEDQDDESETQENHNKFKLQSPMKILEKSQKKIIESPHALGTYKKQISLKQIKSQNVSFSLDSELSLIEQKWNSYFQANYNDEGSQNQLQNEKLHYFSEKNIIHHHKKDERIQNDQKQSSDQQLPSFSHTDTSNYHITPLQSQRSSNQSSDIYNFVQFQDNSQTKQFKRQFTFGNDLNAAFEQKLNFNQQKTSPNEPLFKRFLQKSTIQNFKQKNLNKKQKNNFLKQKPKTSTSIQMQKSFIQTQKVKKKSASINLKIETNKNAQKYQQHQQNERNQQIKQQNTLRQEQSQYIIPQSHNGNQILIIEEPSENSSPQNSNTKKEFQQPKSKQSPIESKNYQKTKKILKEQSAFKNTPSKQQKQRQLIYIDQSINPLSNTHENLIRIDQTQEIHEQNQVQAKNNEVYNKTEKSAESSSYSKIFSEKKFHRTRKGSYNDYRARVSQNQYLSSSEQQNSQKDNKISQQKSQGEESITTATEQVNSNVHISPHYFMKNRSNCQEQVQNLKKYLQKIDNSSVVTKEKNERKETFDFNENFQSDTNGKESQNESFEDSYFVESQNLQHKHKIIEPSQLNSPKQSSRFQNSQMLLPQSYQQKGNQKFAYNSQKQTPIKLIQVPSDTEKNSQISQSVQTKKVNQQANQQLAHPCFQKSLSMIEQLLAFSPQQYTRIYEKIYSQVYEQQLKYKQKLQKQQFLIKFMQQMIQGDKQKIDCESFLCQQLKASQSPTTNSYSDSNYDQEEMQILMNKHIILALVRNLAKK